MTDAICDVCGEEIEEWSDYTCSSCGQTVCGMCLADTEKAICYECLEDKP